MAEDTQLENPYRVVYLPEFDVSVGWAMCRNSMCPNFGIQYDGPAPDGPGEIKDRLAAGVSARDSRTGHGAAGRSKHDV